MNIIVVGAGIVGVSTAIWLQRDGHRVTLVDRTGPAAGASQGNAGVLASLSVVPVTVPGLLGKAPRMLLDKNQPLFLRWGYLPKLLPFLVKYLKHARARKVSMIADGLTELLHDSPDQHLALAQGTGAQNYIETDDYLFGYPNVAAYQADQFAWSIRKERGFSYQEMSNDKLAEYDPALKGRFGFGVRCGGHGRIKDPKAYVEALVAYFVAEGGVMRLEDITGIDLTDGQCIGLQTPNGPLTADKYVLTTGAHSGAWAKTLGITVPLETERGYHIEFIHPSITLRSPIMATAGKFVIHSMTDRLRCAGIVEFGGLQAGPSKPPFNLLKKQMEHMFPDLTHDGIVEWMGHRPATADSLPVIGVSPNADNVFLGYGHHHIGLTAGPKTGRWLAQIVGGGAVNVDLSAYAADRRI